MWIVEDKSLVGFDGVYSVPSFFGRRPIKLSICPRELAPQGVGCDVVFSLQVLLRRELLYNRPTPQRGKKLISKKKLKKY